MTTATRPKPRVTTAALSEALAIAQDNYQLLTERLAELELGLEDRNWLRLSMESQREFSREGLTTICQMARLYFLKNPLVRRAILTQMNYVFGQGVNITAEASPVNDVVQAFLDDPQNQRSLTSNEAQLQLEKELQLFGNIFFAFFVQGETGHVRVRTIPMDEIDDIICDPEDRQSEWYFKRVWQQSQVNPDTGGFVTKQKTAYYPSWDYHPKGGFPATIGGNPVEADTPVYHVAVNKLSDMRFGVSEIYSAIDWSRAYKEFLEDWATITRAYAKFAFRMTTPAIAGAAGVAAAKAKIGTSITSGSSNETNPPPATGSTFIASENVKLDPIRTSGATTSATDGRMLRLMVCSATGIFEHYLTGDPSTGNLATAKSMEMPMLIQFTSRQTLWADVFLAIVNFVVDQAIKAGLLKGSTQTNAYEEEYYVLDPDPNETDPDKQGQPMSRHVDATFPDILEKDTQARVQAIVSAATLGGWMPAGTLEEKLVTTLLLKALGVPQVDEQLALMYPEGETPDSQPETVTPQESARKLAEAAGKLLRAAKAQALTRGNGHARS